MENLSLSKVNEKIEVSEEKISFILEGIDINYYPEVQIFSRDNGAVLSNITSEINFHQDNNSKTLEISFVLFDFNVSCHTLKVIFESHIFTFESLLERYILDAAQFDSHFYMTKQLFGGSTRNLAGLELLYVCLCYLHTMPPNCQFYGGLITLSVFRLAEDLEARYKFFPMLIEFFWKYLNQYEQLNNHSIRWLTSSAYNLSIISLYMNKEVEAKKIIDGYISKGILNRSLPLTYMNYSHLLFLAALLEINSGKVEKAKHLFIECADFCSFAVSEIFSLRNKFYFQHKMDSSSIMETGYSAFSAAAILGSGSFVSDSKMSDYKVNISNLGNFSTNCILIRFSSFIDQKPSSLIKAENNINQLKKKI